jgi:hypothetical protein
MANAPRDANQVPTLMAVNDLTGLPQPVLADSSGNILIAASLANATVSQGGTGRTSFTAYAPIFGGTTATGALQSGTVGNAGEVLTSNGAGALPTFQAAAGGNPFSDATALVKNSVDATKLVIFSASAITTSTTRTITVPDVNDTMVTLGATQTLTGKTLTSPTLTTPVINGATTGTGVASVATASTLSQRDASGNSAFNNVLEGYTTIITAAGTTTLTVASTRNQIFTGTTTQTVVMPVVSTLVLGTQYYIYNDSTGVVSVQSSGLSAIASVPASGFMILTCVATSGVGSGSWEYQNLVTGSSTGTVPVVRGGTGATTLTGILKGNGTGAFTAVTAPSGTIVGTTDTQTLTNKRVTRRTATTNAPGATPTTNSDNVDVQIFTGLNAAITSMTTNLTGTPVATDFIEFQFTDDGTPRAITWGASFASTTVALPTITVASTKLRVLLERGASTWDCVAVV